MDPNSIHGIKLKNFRYQSISPACLKYLNLPSALEQGGFDDYFVFDRFLRSPYYNSVSYAEELMAEDEHCFRGASLFILDSFFVKKQLQFALVHKAPYLENGVIQGVLFHDIPLPNPNQATIQSYLNNPNILISGYTKKHLDVYSIAPARQYGLTQRELDCIRCLLKGYSAKCIALELKLSKRTIEFYLSNIRDKLHLSKSSEIITFAITNNLIPNASTPLL